MDPSKKSAKTKFLAPGVLAKSKNKAKASFGLQGYLSTVGNEGYPATYVSNIMSSAATSLSQNQEGINMGQSPFAAPVVTTKPKDWFSMQELEDLCAAGYKLSKLIRDVPLRPDASKVAEKESVHASENTSSHLIDTDIPILTKRKRVTVDARPRGVNLCKRVSNLEPNKKLRVEIVNNVPIGENGKEMVRHMGKLIRDRNIIPVRIHSWEDLEPRVMEHLWHALTDKFECDHMDLKRDSLLNRMKRLWQNWRGLMKRDNINKNKTTEDAMKDRPQHLVQEDWEWLVKEHYMSADFKKLSERNSKNRGTQTMMHRTGSRPFQDVIWRDMGAKDGKQPSLSDVFRRTRMRKSGTLDVEETKKYEEILDVEKDESLLHFDVIQKCFGQQDHSHVVFFGHGTKPKDVRGPLASREELTRNLRDKEKETNMLKRRLDELEESKKLDHEKMKNLEELMMETNAAMEKRLQFVMTMALGQQSSPNL